MQKHFPPSCFIRRFITLEATQANKRNDYDWHPTNHLLPTMTGAQQGMSLCTHLLVCFQKSTQQANISQLPRLLNQPLILISNVLQAINT